MCTRGAGLHLAARVRVPPPATTVKGRFALVAIGLVLAAAGCGDDEQTAEQGRPQAKLVDSTAVEGGPQRQRNVLRGVVDEMDKTTLTRVAIGPPGGGENGAAVVVTFSSVGGPSVRGQWDEWIVAGAFSGRLSAAGLPARVSATGGHGTFTARPRLRGQPAPRPLSASQQAAVVKAIRSAVKQSGGKVVRLELRQPYGAAVALSIASDDPARFIKNKLRGVLDSLFEQRRRLEGIYLAVLDNGGRVELEWASWSRNPAGSYWVRRDLANCSPIRQSPPPGTEPPPDCPV
jgi:hypothetical protein